MLGNVGPWTWFVQNRDQVQGYLLQHLLLTVIAVGLGLVHHRCCSPCSRGVEPLARSLIVGLAGLLSM